MSMKTTSNQNGMSSTSNQGFKQSVINQFTTPLPFLQRVAILSIRVLITLAV